MDRLQHPSLQPVSYRSPPQSDLSQLPPSYDPVLALSQVGDPLVDATRVMFGPYIGLNFTFGRHVAEGGGSERT